MTGSISKGFRVGIVMLTASLTVVDDCVRLTVAMFHPSEVILLLTAICLLNQIDNLPKT